MSEPTNDIRSQGVASTVGDRGSLRNAKTSADSPANVIATITRSASPAAAVLPKAKLPVPPSDDKRWKIVTGTMRRHGFSRKALIETLHTVQDCFGCLDKASMRFVAQSLRVPLSTVYGVATFYHFFKLKPPGRHDCLVCTGTACYIKHSTELVDVLWNEFKVRPGETTADGEVSVLTARCIGACSMAPVAVFDGEVHGDVTAMELRNQMQKWSRHES
ncbi:MAG: hypothetical protein RIS70_3977 [Planctomycetota bacterium]